MSGRKSGLEWVKFPREVIRKTARSSIPGRHRRGLDALLELTWGWGKPSDQIASSQVAELTGFSSGQVREILCDLLAWGVVTRTDHGPRSAATWALQLDLDQWEIGPTQAGRRARDRKAKVKPSRRPNLRAGETPEPPGSMAPEPPGINTPEPPGENTPEPPGTPLDKRDSPSFQSGEHPDSRPDSPPSQPSAEAKVFALIPPPGEPEQGQLIEVESIPERLVAFFLERRRIWNPDLSEPTEDHLKEWLRQMELLCRIGSPGGRAGPPTAREIAETIFWLYRVDQPTDSAVFWRKNVQAVPKFRIKYHDRLRVEMQTEEEVAQRADWRRAKAERGTLQEGADLVRRIIERNEGKS